jgi:DNA-binding transcriptional LysR family regulator
VHRAITDGDLAGLVQPGQGVFHPVFVVQALRLRVQLRSFDAVCRLVAAEVGIGVVPLTTARRAALPCRSPSST